MTIELPQDPKINYRAALYFLDGHYLLRYQEDGRQISKFVRSTDVQAAFSLHDIDSGWMPAGVVRWGENARGPWYVYSPPAQRVTITLSDAVLEIPIPRTVLVVNGEYSSIYALASEHFSPTVPYFHAPLPNVRSDGHICWGGNVRPTPEPINAQKTWALFFTSPFNQDYSEKKSKSHPSDVRGLLRKLADSNARKFPIQELVRDASSKTIGNQIDQLITEH